MNLRAGHENEALIVRHIRPFVARTILATSLAALAAGCSSIERLKTVGEQPTLSQINNPTTQTGYKPVQMPMPAPQPASYNPNSLWRNGSRAFFKDQRAHQVGDILTVKVKITDKATLENETSAQPQKQRGFRRHRFPRQQADQDSGELDPARQDSDRGFDCVQRGQGHHRPQGRAAH
jgi:flagellar basal body L-ring protein FlgH